MEASNVQEMREALVNIVGYAETARCHTEDAHVLSFLGEIEGWARSALSEPARNCDRAECKDIESAMEVYKKECCIVEGPFWVRNANAPLEHEWLLATAAERKGEGDGR